MSYARELVERGFYLFPIQRDSKVPLSGFSWREWSSSDLNHIHEWEEQYPGCNWAIDCGKSGIAVVDVDIKKDDGNSTLFSLEVNEGLELPETLTFSTPTGGQHLVYQGDIKTGVGDIGPGIDTRGSGGYIVAPGSVINGKKYIVSKNVAIAPVPEWAQKMAAPKQSEVIKTESPVELDRPHDVQDAVHYLEKRAKPAIEGDGGDAQTFKVAAQLKDRGISNDMALELMLDFWNDKCEPPWDVDELATKIRNAYKYSQNSPGAKTAQAAFDAPIESSFEQDENDEIYEGFLYLARLSSVEYDRKRATVADELGIRLSTLDKEVDKLRSIGQSNGDSVSGTEVRFDEPDSWPDLVDGVELLSDLVTVITRYVVLPREAAVAAALWILHTHTLDAFMVSPILCIQSPEKRCGKTTLLSVLKPLVYRPMITSNITAAALFRSVEKWQPTLLIDEADTFLKDSEDLRGILNSGHVRDSAHVIRTVGDSHEPRRFRTWAAKVIALIGRTHPTLEDRSVAIALRRKRSDEISERLRIDRTDSFSELVRKCVRWASDNVDHLKEADPTVPAKLNDRAADNWRCLLAIADAAGGDWPGKARAACISLSLVQDDNEAAGVLVLKDIYELFNARGSRLSSANLATELGKMEERPWPEWKMGKSITSRQVARLLRPFGIRPKDLRVGKENFKGYDETDFEDAFSRYLSISISDTVTSEQNQGVNGDPVRDKENACHGSKSPGTCMNNELSPCHGTNTSGPSVETHCEDGISDLDWLS